MKYEIESSKKQPVVDDAVFSHLSVTNLLGKNATVTSLNAVDTKFKFILGLSRGRIRGLSTVYIM